MTFNETRTINYVLLFTSNILVSLNIFYNFSNGEIVPDMNISKGKKSY